MKQVSVNIGNMATVVTVVDAKSKSAVLTPNEMEMDRLAENTVKSAIKKAKVCKKPVAVYNPAAKTITIN